MVKKSVEKIEEVEKGYRWNLKDIYKDYGEWERDFLKVENLKKELSLFKGTFYKEEKLLEFFIKQEEMDKISYKMFRYPQLARNIDSLTKEAVENFQKIQFIF